MTNNKANQIRQQQLAKLKGGQLEIDPLLEQVTLNQQSPSQPTYNPIDWAGNLGSKIVTGISNIPSSINEGIKEIPNNIISSVEQELDTSSKENIGEGLSKLGSSVVGGALSSLQSLGRGTLNLPSQIVNTATNADILPENWFENKQLQNLTSPIVNNLSTQMKAHPVGAFIGEQLPTAAFGGTTNSLKSAALEGAKYGALQGSLSNEGDLADRITSGLGGGLIGATSAGGLHGATELIPQVARGRLLNRRQNQIGGGTNKGTSFNTAPSQQYSSGLTRDQYKFNALNEKTPDIQFGSSVDIQPFLNNIQKNNAGTITASQIQDIQNLASRVNSAYTPNEKLKAIYDLQQYGGMVTKNTPLEFVWNTWQRAALSSPLNRIKDVISTSVHAGMETGVELASSLWSKENKMPNIGDRLQGAIQGFKTGKEQVDLGIPDTVSSTYETKFTPAKNKFTKTQDMLLKAPDEAVTRFFEEDYLNQILKENGIDPSTITDYSNIPLEYAKEAHRLAKQASLMGNDNFTYQLLQHFRTALNDPIYTINKIQGKLQQGAQPKSVGIGSLLFPFMKYSTNATLRGLDYLGLNTAKQLIKNKFFKESINKAALNKEITRTVLGWSGFALGWALYTVGHTTNIPLSGKGDYRLSNRGLQNLEESQNIQNNSIQIGDLSLPLMPFGPDFKPLLLGIQFGQYIDEGNQNRIMKELGLSEKDTEIKDLIVDVTSNLIKHMMFDSSPIDRPLDTLSKVYDNPVKGLSEFAVNSVVGPFLAPGLLGDIKQALPVKETRSGNIGESLLRQNIIGKLSSPNRTGVSGDTIGNPGLFGSIRNNNELLTNMYNLNRETGSSSFIPQRPPTKMSITTPEGETRKIELSTEELATWEKEIGDLTNKYYTEMMNMSGYQELSSADKAQALTVLKHGIETAVKIEYLNHTPSSIPDFTEGILSGDKELIQLAMEDALFKGEDKRYNKEDKVLDAQDNSEIYSPYRK